MINPYSTHTSRNKVIKIIMLVDGSCLFNEIKNSYNSPVKRPTINNDIVGYITQLQNKCYTNKTIYYDSIFPEFLKKAIKLNKETIILHEQLEKLGVEILTHTLQVKNSQKGKLEFYEKGVDVNLGLDAGRLIYSGEYSRIIIVSGDGDFESVAESAIKNNLQCTVIFPGKINLSYSKIPGVKIIKFPLNRIMVGE